MPIRALPNTLVTIAVQPSHHLDGVNQDPQEIQYIVVMICKQNSIRRLVESRLRAGFSLNIESIVRNGIDFFWVDAFFVFRLDSWYLCVVVFIILD